MLTLWFDDRATIRSGAVPFSTHATRAANRWSLVGNGTFVVLNRTVRASERADTAAVTKDGHHYQRVASAMGGFPETQKFNRLLLASSQVAAGAPHAKETAMIKELFTDPGEAHIEEAIDASVKLLTHLRLQAREPPRAQAVG